MMKAALLAAHTLISTTYFHSGDEVHEACESNKQAARDYVVSVLEAFVFAGATTFAPLVCVPRGVTADDAADIVCQYLKSHPAGRNAAAVTEVFAAVKDPFSCAKQP
jgi:hypothetical protein